MGEKFELTPDQEKQFDEDGAMTFDEDAIGTSQKELSQRREIMIKSVKEMGKSGYVYRTGKEQSDGEMVYGEINGVMFQVTHDGDGVILVAGEYESLPIDEAKIIYDKYRDIALNKESEDRDMLRSNLAIQRHDKAHKLFLDSVNQLL